MCVFVSLDSSRFAVENNLRCGRPPLAPGGLRGGSGWSFLHEHRRFGAGSGPVPGGPEVPSQHRGNVIEHVGICTRSGSPAGFARGRASWSPRSGAPPKAGPPGRARNPQIRPRGAGIWPSGPGETLNFGRACRRVLRVSRWKGSIEDSTLTPSSEQRRTVCEPGLLTLRCRSGRMPSPRSHVF
jgi:hypothetical protein